ncbi:terpene synthase family protein [Streptomyces sp. LE64]|uniref:terpene synthase family protein n=1 Tax=Streptomyces sp. LE64 TaxID=3448653 RepID=UPI0040435BE8
MTGPFPQAPPGPGSATAPGPGARPALSTATRWLSAPYRRHRHAAELERLARQWAAGSGLAVGPAAVRLRAHGLDRLAAVVLSEERDEQVLLYARWLIWVFHLDDHVESRTTPGAVEALFGGLLDRIGPPGTVAPAPRGEADGDGRAVAEALTDLWRRTGRGMSDHWQQRFRRHLRQQRAGCLREHLLRATGTVPTPQEYPRLRRWSSGPWLYDLPEAVLGVELPPAFAATALWRELTYHVGDAANGCNDLLSAEKESAGRITVNHLLVARHRKGLTGAEAVRWVTEHVVDRLDRAAELGRRTPAAAQDLGLSPAAVREVSRVVCATLNFPAAYLTWALGSARYAPPPP